jgi:hypothetical protein
MMRLKLPGNGMLAQAASDPLPKSRARSCERILVPDAAPNLVPAELLAMQGR